MAKSTTNGYFVKLAVFHKLGILRFRPCGLKSIPILENEWKNGEKNFTILMKYPFTLNSKIRLP